MRMATTLDELLVYQKAMAVAGEILAIVKRPSFSKDLELARQLRKGAARVPSDISEGFEQKTDRHFAKYLYDAKGGASELRTQVHLAEKGGHISASERERLSVRYTEIIKMLVGLIAHLERSGWTDRHIRPLATNRDRRADDDD